MDIMNQDQELIPNIKKVYFSEHFQDNNFYGWNVYGVDTAEETELLGTLDEEWEARQIVNEINKLMSEGAQYYEFPLQVDLWMEMEIGDIERYLGGTL